jgi:putative pyruvate formate lyase activating enzyme
MQPGRFEAAYVGLLRSGELDRRVAALGALLAPCRLCPRECGVDRRREMGRCATPDAPVVASWGPHFGEEPPLSGARGSGAIFLANCNLRCVFCQNADISQRPKDFIGRTVTVERLAAIMIELQEQGCHNVNWVSPTHQLPQLVAALAIAARAGLTVPIVYNTNAFDSVAALTLLDGIVDVYMPDLKYADDRVATALSRVRGYPASARAAIAEMFRQVGERWRTSGDGALQRGMLVRVLILPHDLAGVEATLCWLATALSPRIAVSLMSQYRPSHWAARPGRYPQLCRRVTPSEYLTAVAALEKWNEGCETLLQPYRG